MDVTIVPEEAQPHQDERETLLLPPHICHTGDGLSNCQQQPTTAPLAGEIMPAAMAQTVTTCTTTVPTANITVTVSATSTENPPGGVLPPTLTQEVAGLADSKTDVPSPDETTVPVSPPIHLHHQVGGLVNSKTDVTNPATMAPPSSSTHPHQVDGLADSKTIVTVPAEPTTPSSPTTSPQQAVGLTNMTTNDTGPAKGTSSSGLAPGAVGTPSTHSNAASKPNASNVPPGPLETLDARASGVPTKRSSGTKRKRTSHVASKPGSQIKGDRWNDMLFELLKYRAKHGSCIVPKTSALGRWVARQRILKQKIGDRQLGGSHTSETPQDHEELSEERIMVLNSIDFVWDPIQSDYDSKWKKRFDELVEYIKVKGHCSVSQSTPLGKWIKIQRENKKEADLKKAGIKPKRAKQRPCLSRERIEKLESIGFQWKVKKPPIGWEKRYQQLVEYKQVHGDCNVPQSYPPDRPFGRWVMKQRCEYSLKVRGEKSQLSDDRETRLNAVGFSWVAPGVRKKTFITSSLEEKASMV